jgi:O-antigen/teichoic acid export membrane protein
MAQTATRKIAYNTAVQLIGKGVTVLVGVVSIGILTRYLGPAGYGNFTTALVYLTFFGMIADMGLFTIAVREISRHESRMQEIVSNTLALRAVLSLVIFGVAYGVALLLPYTPDVKIGIAIVAISQLFGLLNSSLATVFQVKLRMDFTTLADVAGRIASFIAVLIVAKADLGFFAVVGTAAVGALVTLLISTFFVRRYVKVRVAMDWQLWKQMLKETAPLGAAVVVSSLYLKLDVLMLSLMRSAEDVGVYGAIYKLVDILQALPVLFGSSVLPLLVRRLKESNAAAHRVAQRAFDVLFISSVGVAFGGLVVGSDVLRIIGGQEFVRGTSALQVTLFALISIYVVTVYGIVYIAKNRQIQVLKVGLLGLTVNFLLNLYAIPKYGILGAAWVTVISECVIGSIFYIGIRRQLGRYMSLRVVPRATLAAVLMAAIIWPLRTHFAVALVVGAIAYSGLVILFRAMPTEVLRELVGRSTNV